MGESRSVSYFEIVEVSLDKEFYEPGDQIAILNVTVSSYFEGEAEDLTILVVGWNELFAGGSTSMCMPMIPGTSVTYITWIHLKEEVLPGIYEIEIFAYLDNRPWLSDSKLLSIKVAPAGIVPPKRDFTVRTFFPFHLKDLAAELSCKIDFSNEMTRQEMNFVLKIENEGDTEISEVPIIFVEQLISTEKLSGYYNASSDLWTLMPSFELIAHVDTSSPSIAHEIVYYESNLENLNVHVSKSLILICDDSKYESEELAKKIVNETNRITTHVVYGHLVFLEFVDPVGVDQTRSFNFKVVLREQNDQMAINPYPFDSYMSTFSIWLPYETTSIQSINVNLPTWCRESHGEVNFVYFNETIQIDNFDKEANRLSYTPLGEIRLPRSYTIKINIDGKRSTIDVWLPIFISGLPLICVMPYMIMKHSGRVRAENWKKYRSGLISIPVIALILSWIIGAYRFKEGVYITTLSYFELLLIMFSFSSLLVFLADKFKFKKQKLVHTSLPTPVQLEYIEGIQAHLFFPSGTPKKLRTLDHHKKHLYHRLIVNHKMKPPKAYYLTPDSYGWEFIQKYPARWVSEIVSSRNYSIDDPEFTRKWCNKKGYALYQKTAEKIDLFEVDQNIQ